ncbi:SDR family NAD(P)-dependent oxidoreductase [Streptomyces sp. NPDC059875]|uniref:SDR family NAD(P)-dependent oxidoreductase n=1 Tax=unclassified Streptomyces TaxID=2593676 RepID=UPI00364CEE3D
MGQPGNDRRSVVITGGGTGIGRAAAHAFADEGHDVLIVGRDETALKEAAHDRPAIRHLALDITAPGAPEEIVRTAVTALGGIDVLVNNAAVVKRQPLEDIDRRIAEEQIATNLLAPLLLTQAALPQLRAAGGVVVNVSASAAVRGWAGSSVYGATKAGLDFLTRTWAVEQAPHGVRVVSVSPGPVETGIARASGLDEEQIARLRAAQKAGVPMGRIGQPEEIAWWIVTMARPEGAFATGVVLPVDGGAATKL